MYSLLKLIDLAKSPSVVVVMRVSRLAAPCLVKNLSTRSMGGSLLVYLVPTGRSYGKVIQVILNFGVIDDLF